jgi:hypothetical protein
LESIARVRALDDGGPYTWLGVVAGLAYLAAVVTLRVRS